MNRTVNHPRNKHTNAPGKASFAINTLSASLILVFSAAAHALPAGGVVAAGAAGIANSASATTITQSSASAVINWQSFGIGAGQTVKFIQPGSSSVALNRVLGSDPSSILGNLTANGKVFLLNPNGILFGSGASVNVGGLVASTLSISDANFMAGRYAFTDAGNGTVVNQGNINAADGGYVALMGKSVSNQGVISARMGTVALAAGNAITMDIGGDGLLNLSISQGAVNALIENGGMIRADGGRVLLTAQAAGNLLQTVVNNTGVIQAQTIGTNNGAIFLLGDMQTGTVSVGGTLDASGTGAGQTGGSVTATGHHVGLFSGQINASGDAGGGTVLVGGGYQGNNPAVQNASATYMSADSTINVDALTNRKGGTAVLWSNDSTRAYGAIAARGGALVGDGGLIETSGHWLDVSGIKVSASASNGKPGMWLLDPTDVTISNAATSTPPVGGFYSPAPGASASNINAGEVIGLLTGGTDVTITTKSTGTAAGDINFNAGPGAGGTFAWTRVGAAPNTTLALNAAGNVNINTAISPTQGNLVICCGKDINVDSAITMVRGSLLLSAGGTVNQRAAITSTDGNIAMCAAVDIKVTAALSSTRGTVIADRSLASRGVLQGLSFAAGNAATGPGLAGGGGAVTIAPPGGTVTIVQSAVVGEEVPVSVIYNPLTYGAPVIPYALSIPNANPLTVRRLVFPEVANQTQGAPVAATFTGLLRADSANFLPPGVTLAGAGTGNFSSTATLGTTPVTFSGFSLVGGLFALPGAAFCCTPLGTPVVQRTSGTIVAAPPAPAIAGLIPGLIPGVIPNVRALPYEGIAEEDFATFAYLPGLVPTYASDAGNVFFTIKEEEKEVVPPTVIPFISPPPPYVAPRYAPKPARN